ncbi:MAG TPA: ATP-binding cassette domain-containing protein [Actinomycetota bacterium]|nr:ATP-binding cassette domain-containing protein [Actinomycetota bacterium]
MSINPAPAPIVAIRDLRFRYPGMDHDALWMPALDISRPGLVAVTGCSGAGKSTLIELMAGTLSERYSGSVRVLGKEWAELRRDRSRQFHLRRIGLIPQDLGLLPNQTPRQMLCQALLDAGVPKGECDDRVIRALSQMDLDVYMDRRIADMSGGQKQRVAIARALVRNVELILADEPTANLNTQLGDEIVALLKQIGRTIPVVVVTHDPRIALLCDDQVHLAPPPAEEPVAVGMAQARRPHLKVAIVSTAATCGVAAIVAMFVGAASPAEGPTASQLPGHVATAAAPATPPSPGPGTTPSQVTPPAAAPPQAAPPPAATPAAAAPQTKATRTTTVGRTLPAVQEAPVVQVADPSPEASVPATSVQITPASVEPPPVPLPTYLQWWQAFSGFFGGSPSPQPTIPPHSRVPGN